LDQSGVLGESDLICTY